MPSDVVEIMARRQYEAELHEMGDTAASRYPAWDQMSVTERKPLIDDAQAAMIAAMENDDG